MTAAYEWLAEASLWWWPRFADHLWQTTLFVLVVLLASFALRGGAARSRHNFWLLAAAKFVIPAAFFVFFAQLAGVDSMSFFQSAPGAASNALALSGVTQPASALASNYEVTVVATAPGDGPGGPGKTYLILTAIWLGGSATLLSFWGIRRRRLVRSLGLGSNAVAGREWRMLARAREKLGLKQEVGLVVSPLAIEPAVWRVWSPVVVMPDSIAGQLSDPELESIMLHELVHIQRRDNLTGSLQLALCALLWFHPLVWFISRKLFDEREQACDERVMEICGSPEAYASGILKVVRFCFGWRVAGVAGAASGSNLRRRIENIMTIENNRRRTGAASRFMAAALVTAALVVLVCAGVYSEAREAKEKTAVVDPAKETSQAQVADTGSNLLTEATQQNRKTPPPAPAAPLEAPPPAQPDQPAQLAEAPQPPSVPQPASAPQPAQAPQPANLQQPTVPPQPAQAPQPGNGPIPSQAPPPPPPATSGYGIGKGSSGGVGWAITADGGRGSGTGIGWAVGRGVGLGVGSGVGVGPALAPFSVGQPASPTSAPPPPPAKGKEKQKDRVQKGRLIEAPQPVYPVEAREKKIEGTVSVSITIDESGNVIFAKAKSGPEALYDASQDAAYKARFEPAQKDGKPVQVAATLAYNFVLR